jgi:hypothetical protein
VTEQPNGQLQRQEKVQGDNQQKTTKITAKWVPEKGIKSITINFN